MLENETQHLPRLGSGLNQLRNEDVFCDITITVDKKAFRAHKAVLTAGSDYFRAMFKGGFQEEALSNVTIPGESDIFSCILEFIYTGRFQVSQDSLLDVLNLANYLQVSHVVSVGAEHLVKRLDGSHQEFAITPSEIADTWVFARNIRHTLLADTVESYVTSHISALSDMEEFKEHMPFDLLSMQLEKGEELAASASEEMVSGKYVMIW